MVGPDLSTDAAISVGEDPAASHGARPRRRLSGVVGRLTATNVVVLVAGLITAPLQARALGPDGRGLLAAIMVPVTIAPWAAGLGLGVFTMREAARGRSTGELVGTFGTASLLIGFVVVALAVPVASFFADGRETVFVFLVIGLALVPLALVGDVLWRIATGLEHWGTVIAVRLIPAVSSCVAIVVLFVADALTVSSAATVLFAGGVLSIVPLVPIIRAAIPLRFDRSLAKVGFRFGAKAWVTTLSSLANVRLDQLIMIRLVDARELGLYAIAATLAAFSASFTAALGTSLFPRVAVGEHGLAARSLRTALAAVTVASVAVAAVTPILLDIVFGSEFADATPMVWILLAAGIPLAGLNILRDVITSAGMPGSAARAELIALLITIPGIFVLVPPLGGVGAAIVSAAAYSLSFGYLLLVCRRRFDTSLAEFLIVRGSDLRWLSERIREWRAARRG